MTSQHTYRRRKGKSTFDTLFDHQHKVADEATTHARRDMWAAKGGQSHIKITTTPSTTVQWCSRGDTNPVAASRCRTRIEEREIKENKPRQKRGRRRDNSAKAPASKATIEEGEEMCKGRGGGLRQIEGSDWQKENWGVVYVSKYKPTRGRKLGLGFPFSGKSTLSNLK